MNWDGLSLAVGGRLAVLGTPNAQKAIVFVASWQWSILWVD